MNLANNNKPKILINIDVGNEIIPEGHLKIEDIEILPKMQQRATFKTIQEIENLDREEQLKHLTDDIWVKIYTRLLELSDPPPVMVYKVGERLILVDGFNRVRASSEAGYKTIPAIVIRGTELDALKASCRVNIYYGQSCNDEDKACAIIRFYETIKQDNKREKWTESNSKVAGYLGHYDSGSVGDWKQKTIEDCPSKRDRVNKFFERHIQQNGLDLWEGACIPEYSHNTMNKTYCISELAKATCFKNENELDRWIRIINRKKQVIIYGPPGTGKTFIAEKLAKHLIGGSNGFSELVQFHPAYSYEDFIQGIRPKDKDGQLTYSMVPGRFLEFCKKAESREGICVLIIDEINRANLAQVFGELMYLLEYRDKEIPLAGGNTFRIPSNVRIIGTMNTADRSIALVDHALRRRFAFIEIRPNYEVLENYHKTRNPGFKVDRLIKVLKKLNQAIADKNYELGISFFLTEKLTEDIEDIWKMEIEPYLEEYFFDRLEKVDEFRWDKIKQQVLPELLPDFDEAFPDSLIDKIEEDF